MHFPSEFKGSGIIQMSKMWWLTNTSWFYIRIKGLLALSMNSHNLGSLIGNASRVKSTQTPVLPRKGGVLIN